jgi:hypothetical protein
MALGFGQLVGGMGIVANAQREAETAEQQSRLNLLRIQEQNRLENERQQQAPITADYINNLNFTQPQTGNVTYGDGVRQIPVEKPAVVEQAPVAPVAPVPQVRPGLLTIPKASAVTPQEQKVFNQAIAIPPAKVEPFTPGFAMFAGKQFDFMRDGPTLVKPLINSQGQMNEQAYTATRDALAKSTQDAKTKMQQSGPFAGNEEMFYYKNQLDYLNTTYNALKRQGKVVAATAPAPQQTSIPLDKRVPVETLGGYELPSNQLKRLNGLQDSMPKQLQAPATQALVKRAQELGVDPAAAVAVYALENNYGGQKTSGAGAVGSMQIMPGTYADVRRIFTDTKVSQVPPGLQQLAAGLPQDMSKATPEQLRDAGLLYMYYLQNDKKIPVNMLGAAYHAGPNRGDFQNGLVPNVYDKVGKTWTPDYNAMYVSLYNNYMQLNGQSQAQALNQPPVAANKNNPQAQNQPVIASNLPAANQPAPVVGADGNPIRQTAGVRTDIVATKDIGQPIIRMPEAGTIDPNKYDAYTQQALVDREFVKKLALVSAQTGNPAKAIELAGRVRSMDMDLYRMAGERGVAEFTRYNDPTRMIGVWSKFTNQNLQTQPRSDGKWDLYANGKMLGEGLTRDDLMSAAQEDMSAKYREGKATLKEFVFKEQFKTQMAITQESAKQQGQIFVDTNKINREMVSKIYTDINKGNVNMAEEAFKAATNVDVKISPAGENMAIVSSKDGRNIGVLDFRTGQFQTMPGGEKIEQAPNIKYLSQGMPVANRPVWGATQPPQ